MGFSRGTNFKQLPLNIVGSSVFGIYSKQSTERTYNMTISDNWLVPYPGYKVGLPNTIFENEERGRGLYQSVRLDRMFAVFDKNVYRIELNYNHETREIQTHQVVKIGELDTDQGIVYFAENNKPQILISDNTKLYLYDETLSAGNFNFTTNFSSNNKAFNFSTKLNFAIGEPIEFHANGGTLPTVAFGSSPPATLSEGIKYYVANFSNPTGNTTTIEIANTRADAANGVSGVISVDAVGTVSVESFGFFQEIYTDFTPGFITFHDTYFIAAAKDDLFYDPPGQNTWRLSGQNNGFVWPSDAQHVGLLESKSDIIQAVTRFPSRGNMILVMGKAVTEFWFDTGNQLFPYQRQNQSSIDYGCVSPATVAVLDDIVVWLGQNEKSGPIVMYTTGGPEPKKITTDGIDFQLSEINNPEDSQGFIFRKNGHLFYHLNFYTDNFSYVFDLTRNRIFNATDERLNYYIMGHVVWYQNQYFSVSRNRANLYIFDTVFNTYEDTNDENELITNEVPRIRYTANARLPSQDYFIVNDVSFTIETGESDYIYQNHGPIFLTTEDGDKLLTEQYILEPFLLFENGNFWNTEDGNLVIGDVEVSTDPAFLISQQDNIVPVTPRVDLSVSYDGGSTFSSNFPYDLNPVGKRKNKLIWWNCGMGNDVVFQFNFWNVGAVVAENGVVNLR